MSMMQMLLGSGGASIVGAWNPSDKNANVVLSNNNLTMTNTNTSLVGSVRSTNSLNTGKGYIEFLVGGGTGPTTYCGCANASASIVDGAGAATGAVTYSQSGQIHADGVLQTTVATYTTGDIIGMLVDRTGGTVSFTKNNAAVGSSYTLPSGAMFLRGTSFNNRSITLNQTPTYAIPSGYLYWGN